MIGRLAGKIALITGGSTGIGQSTATLFAAEGARVFVTARRPEQLAEAVAAMPGDVTGIPCDSADLEQLDALYARIAEEAGRLDMVFANAGVGDFAPLGAITEEQVDRMLGINLKGVIFTVQKALPLLSDGASVILTASSNSIAGTAGLSVYNSTKAAVRNLARSWILELSGRQIRVNVVSPGPTDTPMLDGPFDADQKKAFIETFAQEIPSGRIGRPEEVAAAALFLAGAESSYVNGVELFVDGGLAQV